MKPLNLNIKGAGNLLGSLFLTGCFYLAIAQPSITKENHWIASGHAHNDYERAFPLDAALEAGFTSIEVDLFYHKGKIKVAHRGFWLGNKPDFETLYLVPLERRISSFEGLIANQDSTKIVLMLDLKSDPELLYPLLNELFCKYQHLIDHRINGEHYFGPLVMMNSGKRDIGLLMDHPISFWVIDGQRPEELSLDPEFVTRMSYNYNKRFSWNGKGEMPAEELTRLRSMINETHQSGKQLRFWATPHEEALWSLFLTEGVDLINVDDLNKYQKFYFSRSEPLKHTEK